MAQISNKTKNNNEKGRDLIAVLFHVLGIIFMVIFFLIVGVMLVPGLLGYKTYNVVSGSMAPELPVGSMVYVEETAPEELIEGDIIAYYSNENVVTHRIIEIDEANEEFHTKGDRNQVEDMLPVAYDDVIGKVKTHVPYLGIVGAYLASFMGKILLILFGLIGLVLTCL